MNRIGENMALIAANRYLVGASLLMLLFLPSSQGTVPATPAESAPAANPAVSSPPAVAEAASAAEVASPPLHITYPAVGMDQDILPLSPTADEDSTGSVVPPKTLDAYWLTPYGSPGPGSTNTTYIAGHSWEDRGTAFNNISIQAKLGDQLMITTAKGTLSYQVTAITTENKATLKDSAIWAKVPGKVILITCYTADFRGTNIIVEASPLPAG